jgi:hypothetical protein
MIRIPTALSLPETEMLRSMAAFRNVVEAGTLLGYSTVVMAKVARKVTSIDRHTGYDKLPYDTWREYLNNLERFNVAKNVTSVKGPYELLSEYQADFTFIDLDGTFDTTFGAILRCSSPWIGIHDYDRNGCKGVAQAIDVAAACGAVKIVTQKDTLMILRKVG